MTPTFSPGLDHDIQPRPGSLVFAFQGDRLILHANSRRTEPVEFHELRQSSVTTSVYLGLLGDRECFGLRLSPEAVLPPELKTEDLRDSFSSLDEAMVGLAGRGFQLSRWSAAQTTCR